MNKSFGLSLRNSALAMALLFTSTAVVAQASAATLYKSASCGCCVEYAKYLRQQGFQVHAINHPNMHQLQQQLGTDNVASCHTVKVGNYVVEGHVPVQAIRKMLAEKPNIKGIALPGMPYNSPGMGPEKKGSLNVLRIGKQGQAQGVFMVL